MHAVTVLAHGVKVSYTWHGVHLCMCIEWFSQNGIHGKPDSFVIVGDCYFCSPINGSELCSVLVPLISCNVECECGAKQCAPVWCACAFVHASY